MLTIARLTKDPAAPAVRITREEGAAGVLLHEELSDGLFESINNVVQANSLLSQGRSAFVLGEPVYYRIYAERQHVDPSREVLQLLATTALRDMYAPNLYWLTKLDAATIAEVFCDAVAAPKNFPIRGVIRAATVLGQECSDWLFGVVTKLWGRHPQPPDYVWVLKQIRSDNTSDPRLKALRQSDRAQCHIPPDLYIPMSQLLASPAEAASQLTRCCLQVFKGSKDYRQACRHLDVIAYGGQLGHLGAKVRAAIDAATPLRDIDYGT